MTTKVLFAKSLSVIADIGILELLGQGRLVQLGPVDLSSRESGKRREEDGALHDCGLESCPATAKG